MRHPILASDAEMRAAHRILEWALNSSAPLIQRGVAEALHDSKPSDALAFAKKMHGALIASEVPVRPIFSHVRASPVGTPAVAQSPYLDDGRD